MRKPSPRPRALFRQFQAMTEVDRLAFFRMFDGDESGLPKNVRIEAIDAHRTVTLDALELCRARCRLLEQQLKRRNRPPADETIELGGMVCTLKVILSWPEVAKFLWENDRQRFTKNPADQLTPYRLGQVMGRCRKALVAYSCHVRAPRNG
jgi:hypothetical protein